MAEVEWSVEAARTGAPSLKIARKHAHSRYDPERESHQLAEQVIQQASTGNHDGLVIIGSGLGYVTRKLAATYAGSILVWDPFPELKTAVEAELETAALDSAAGPTSFTQSHVCPVDPQPAFVSTSQDFDSALRQLGPRPYLWIHPGYEHVCRFEVRFALRALRRRQPGRSRRRIADAIVSKRALDAAARIPFANVVDQLGQCLEGQTVIIASGGPSLRSVLPSLANHLGGVRLAAVKTLSAFEAANAHVHFATTVDLRDLFKTFHIDNTLPFDMLLADTSSAPSMLDAQRDRLCLFHQRTPQVHEVLWHALGFPIIDEPNVSVSETAMLLAHQMGARRFILAGVDLDSEDPRYREQFEAQTTSGAMANTNSHYFHAARYLSDYCSRLSHGGCEVLRLGNGLKIEGSEEINAGQFDRILRQLPRFTTPTLETGPHPNRLQASRRFFQDVARSPLQPAKAAATHHEIKKNDLGWVALGSTRTREAVRRSLSLLDQRQKASVQAQHPQ